MASNFCPDVCCGVFAPVVVVAVVDDDDDGLMVRSVMLDDAPSRSVAEPSRPVELLLLCTMDAWCMRCTASGSSQLPATDCTTMLLGTTPLWVRAFLQPSTSGVMMWLFQRPWTMPMRRLEPVQVGVDQVSLCLVAILFCVFLCFEWWFGTAK